MFSSNLAVSVNSCPTKEICIQIGLKQVYPLASFLFFLVEDYLSDIFRKLVVLNLFYGFRAGSSDLVISHLQYEDTIFMLVDASVDNLWLIKEILLGYELSLIFLLG